MITVALSLHSCRSEDFLQDKEKSKEDFKVSLLNRQQLDQQKPLLQELSKLKSKFRYKNIDRKLAKSAQDDIFEGAIIGTNQVLLIEKNGNKTYTFPVYRTYMSDKTESLIVKENEDHTFSGILVQYDLTKEEKQQFLTGQNTEINSKIKIFDVDKLNLNAKTNVDVIGCFVITWETGWCSANVHYTGGPGGCTVGGAPAPMIQSIEYVCENGNPADNGESGESGSTGPVVGAGIDLGAYFSIPFISIGYQYYETEDDLDPNYLHYMSVVNYFSSLGTTLNQLRTTNPDLFYYTFFYFKDNGINPTTKAFITQRLAGLNAWYVAVNNNPNSIPANNQYFLNWAYKYLVLNPDVTWEEFYEEYLATPCDQLKAIKDKPGFTNKMTELKNNVPTGTQEKGFIIRDIPNQEFSPVVQGGGMDGGVMFPFKDNTPQDLEELYRTYGTAHNHLESKINHVGVFSPEDIGALYYLGMFETFANNPHRSDFPKKTIMYVITNRGLFAMKINDFNKLYTFAKWWSDMVMSDVNNGTEDSKKYTEDHFSNPEKYNITNTSTKEQQIKGFLRFIKDKNIGIDLYEGDKESFGGWKKLTLKTNLDGTFSYSEEPCN